MSKQDKLKDFMKEIPREEPSLDFTRKVMDRVNLETKKTSPVYRPLISMRGWKRITFGMLILGIGVAILRNYFPGGETPSILHPLYSLDLTQFLKPFNLVTKFLSNLSPTFLTCLVAVSLLIMVDQVSVRFIRR
ncbi:MAG: hypothetical protein M0R39_14240 [Prolixibacteraceae bacterium]|jgi:hypothetical protein|nr:hypothetical protein [Prolixibacteraceae bacterium]